MFFSPHLKNTRLWEGYIVVNSSDILEDVENNKL